MNKIKKLATVCTLSATCLIGAPEVFEGNDTALSRRQKSIIPIAAFTASGDLMPLENAFAEGLDAGLTVNEIKEILIHSYAYAGFPRALNSINTFIAVMNKRKEQGINDTIGREATPLPSDFDINAYGHEVRNTLVGRDISKRTSGYAAFTPAIDRFLVEHLFADIFYRDLLNYQDRELATISILAAMNGTAPQLKAHLNVSMNVGLSKSQLEDCVSVLRQKVSAESAKKATKALHELMEINSVQTPKKSVKVIRKETPTKGAADKFTGNVTVESRFTSGKPNSYRGGVVNFEAGARTAWHTHPYGQTLVVISGRGLVQSESDTVLQMLPGDVVWIPADVRHWHGAAPDNPVAHVAISDPKNGSTVKWMEHVSDEQYSGVEK